MLKVEGLLSAENTDKPGFLPMNPFIIFVIIFLTSSINTCILVLIVSLSFFKNHAQIYK